MDKRETKNYLFELTFVLWYGSEILIGTTMSNIFGISKSSVNIFFAWLILFLLLLQILFVQKYSLMELLRIGLISAPILLSTVLSGNNTILSVWMFIVASKSIDLDSIIYKAYYVLLALVPIVIVLFFLGIAPNKDLYRNGILRYSLGFIHPNTLGLRVFQLVGCHFYIHRKSLRFVDYVFGVILGLFVFFVPNSQTAYICIAVLLIAVIIQRMIEFRQLSNRNVFGALLIIGYLILNFLSVLFSLIGTADYTGLERLDRFLSIRFSASHNTIGLYGISVFGQRVYISEAERAIAGISRRLYLDNAYASILVRYGVVVYIGLSLLYLVSMLYFYKNNNRFILTIMFVYALYGVMEIGLYMLTHNIFLLALSYVLYGRELQNETTEISTPKRIRIYLRPRGTLPTV